MANLKTCKCQKCVHDTREIDIDKDEFEHIGRYYYHKDCLKIRNDIVLIKDLWHNHISPNVVYSQLVKVLQDLIFNKGISSDYLVFLMNYIIKHKMVLRYPAGIRYYIDNQEIKTAYNKRKIKSVSPPQFVIPIDNDEPKFVIKPTNKSGFGSIFGGDK